MKLDDVSFFVRLSIFAFMTPLEYFYLPSMSFGCVSLYFHASLLSLSQKRSIENLGTHDGSNTPTPWMNKSSPMAVVDMVLWGTALLAPYSRLP